MRRTGREWAVAMLALLVASVLGLALATVHGTELGPVGIFAGLFAVQAASWPATQWVERRFRTETWQLDAAAVAAALVLLPAAGVVVALAGGTLVGQVLVRRRPVAALMNTAAVGAGVAGASLAFESLGGMASDGSARQFVAALVAVVVLGIPPLALLGLMVWVTRRVPLRGLVLEWWRVGLPRTPLVGCFGYAAGLAGTVTPLAPLLVVPALGFLVYVLAEHLRAEQDRERAETLFGAAEKVHAQLGTDDVLDALVEAAPTLLRGGTADVVHRAPEVGELGVAIDDAADRWLVVRGGPETDDDNLLPALAAIGRSALMNSRLVEELRHRAVHDELTDLPNSILFSDRVNQAAATLRDRERFVVAALDLDAFRKVNDSLGHSVGDRLLQVVAERLLGVVRAGDTVARLGSDGFLLLLPGVTSAETAAVLTEKLLAAVSRPIHLDGQDVFMTACAGLAFFPDDGRTAEHLLRNADSALHRAKAVGPASYQIYATGMNELAHQRLARESELHRAVRRDELRIRYQPQVSLRSGRIIAVEALVRWEHPTLGLLGPHEFVPLAEESGLITEVDMWVLRHTARQAMAWRAEGLPPVRVAVNLSARHFQFPERLLGTLRDVLSESDLPAELLELEVTEGLAVMEETSAAILQRVRELGISIAIDDFGTGYSMLGRLHRFPVDRLKIDRQFVKEIVAHHDEAPIVAAIIAMARSLSIETVAEGVETLDQRTFLHHRGCDVAQGYLFSHPVEAVEIARMLRADSVGVSPISS